MNQFDHIFSLVIFTNDQYNIALLRLLIFVKFKQLQFKNNNV